MSAETSPHSATGEPPRPRHVADTDGTWDETSAVPPAGTELWWLRVMLGVVALGAGAIVLAWPDATLRVVAVLFGLNLLAEGILRVLQSVVGPGGGVVPRILYALLGLVSIVLGVLCLRNVTATLAVLVLLVGLSWIVAGVVELIAALSTRPPGRWDEHTVLGLLLAATGVLAGTFVLAYPDVTLVTLVFLVAGTLLVFGTVSIANGLRLRMRPDRNVDHD